MRELPWTATTGTKAAPHLRRAARHRGAAAGRDALARPRKGPFPSDRHAVARAQDPAHVAAHRRRIARARRSAIELPRSAARDPRPLYHEDVARLQTIAGDLLDASRNSSARIGVERRPIMLDEVVSEIARPLAMQAQEKGIALELMCREHPLPIWGDPIKLPWVITNLVGNALRYTPAGGRITIEIRQRGSVPRARSSAIPAAGSSAAPWSASSSPTRRVRRSRRKPARPDWDCISPRKSSRRITDESSSHSGVGRGHHVHRRDSLKGASDWLISWSLTMTVTSAACSPRRWRRRAISVMEAGSAAQALARLVPAPPRRSGADRRADGEDGRIRAAGANQAAHGPPCRSS